MNFPNDFTFKMHEIVPGAKRWTLDKDGKTIISVVGGGIGLYGDGINTFEMYDYREYNPQGFLTADDINAHLEKNPL